VPRRPARLGPAVDVVTCSECHGGRFDVTDACWTHARQHLADSSSEEDARSRAKLTGRIESLSAELRELIRKTDWNNRHEQRGTEQDSWRRALLFLGGPRSVERCEPTEIESHETPRPRGISEPLRRAWRKVRPPKPVTLDLAGVKLEAALRQPGCLICTMAAESVRRWLFMLLWEGVMDPQVRGRIRASDGFCAEHWWQLHEVEQKELHSVGGVAILAEDILTSFAEQLRSNRVPAVARSKRCLACRAYRTGEDTALSGARRHLERPEFRVAYFANARPCQSHRRTLSARIEDPDLANAVLRHVP
jgi:hypothetical protein